MRTLTDNYLIEKLTECLEKLKSDMPFAEKKDVAELLAGSARESSGHWGNGANRVMLNDKPGDEAITEVLAELMLATDSTEEQDFYLHELLMISDVRQSKAAKQAFDSVIRLADKQDDFDRALSIYNDLKVKILKNDDMQRPLPKSDWNPALQRIVPTMNHLKEDDRRIAIVASFADNISHIAPETETVLLSQLQINKDEATILSSRPTLEETGARLGEIATERAILHTLNKQFSCQ